MSEHQGQGKAFDNEQRSAEVKSSAEKLQDAEPVGSQTPGAENPDSQEIKREINPNTE